MMCELRLRELRRYRRCVRCGTVLEATTEVENEVG